MAVFFFTVRFHIKCARLIHYTLLRIKKGDLKCKTGHKLSQKQFNILNDEYWKFLI